MCSVVHTDMDDHPKPFDSLFADVRCEYERLVASYFKLTEHAQKAEHLKAKDVLRDSSRSLEGDTASKTFALKGLPKVVAEPRLEEGHESESERDCGPLKLDKLVQPVQPAGVDQWCSKEVANWPHRTRTSNGTATTEVTNIWSAEFDRKCSDKGRYEQAQSIVTLPDYYDSSAAADEPRGPPPILRCRNGTAAAPQGEEGRNAIDTLATSLSRQESDTGGYENIESMEVKLLRLRAIFDRLDLDKDGRLTVDEVFNLAKTGQRRDLSKLEIVKCIEVCMAIEKGEDADDFDAEATPRTVLSFSRHEDIFLDFHTFSHVALKRDADLRDFPEDVQRHVKFVRQLAIREEAAASLKDFFRSSYTSDLTADDQAELRLQKVRIGVDMAMAVVILANTMTLGLGADVEWVALEYAELGFNIFFVLEVCFKLWDKGLRQYFMGADRTWHVFDFGLSILAAMDISFLLLSETASLNENVTLIRLVRLARLQRFVKLLRYKLFHELNIMVKGVAAGFRTLFWAILLLGFMVYFTGLVLRMTIGFDVDSCVETPDSCSRPMRFHMTQTDMSLPFNTMPNAMLTVFRCVTGDCSSPSGTPLTVILTDIYGALFVLPYCLTYLFVTFGLFNLIMAMFVDTVMEASRLKRRMNEDKESVRVASQLQTIALKIFGIEEADGRPRSHCFRVLSKLQDYFTVDTGDNGVGAQNAALAEFNLQVSRSMFEKVVCEKEVSGILDDLEIGNGDRRELFDVLDADGSGNLDLQELISGLLKLRGGADKSDVVAALLCIRALQRSTKEQMTQIYEQGSELLERHDELADHIHSAGPSGHAGDPMLLAPSLIRTRTGPGPLA
eukprot:TRINITY_DN19813_c0_g2_i1.p1 TRINITY_DN19813_c0_g2~~TRINITY_DN19813_c0_g2_i1.p1  ORF type:complete len:843 (+),score=208.59 TRINITY_DN19813_c0_g2_i1:118-2646(+)